MPTIRLSLLFLLFSVQLFAQDLGEGWLISLPEKQHPENLCLQFSRENQTELPHFSLISQSLNAWQLWLPGNNDALGAWLSPRRDILQIQRNFLVTLRSVDTIPNDPNFAQQWQYINPGGPNAEFNADLDAELAWNISRGGLSPAGDTLVIAVVDGGVNNHPDLAANIWVNREEIPNDQQDNDQNGFVDDVRGWNFFSDNNNIAGGNTGHGTPVSAIIGAKGNNNLGISGVNWNIKIMFVAGGGDAAKIIKSYDYILKSRKRYNQSFGQHGAFVIATNSSFGTDNGHPADAPLWCAMYDSLGHAGILNVAATANNPVDVDVVGDLPTTCPSEFLIAVTSLTKLETKAADAAWGPINVDLGAYGDGVYSTDGSSNYGVHSGTSFATPQVTGALGLLYSSPCPNLIALAKTSPPNAALSAKSVIMASVKPVEELIGVTVTGGRLNLYNMLKHYESQCTSCPSPILTLLQGISPFSAHVKWVSSVSGGTVYFRWRKIGVDGWTVIENPMEDFNLNGLETCTRYQAQIRVRCGNNSESDWSAISEFSTIGCCAPPSNIKASLISETTATFNWNSDGVHPFYFRWKTVNQDWSTESVSQPPFTLHNLFPCRVYDFQVAVNCGSIEPPAYSDIQQFETAGCGACLDAPYCSAKAESSDEEWIKKVKIGDWQSETANGGAGYQNLTNENLPELIFIPNQEYLVTLTPGYLGLSYKEYFRLYVDFNNDGDFDDANELAFDPGFASDVPVSGLITVPVNIVTGKARMRVLMKYSQTGNQTPTPCGTFGFGQVEDYCVQVGSGPSTGMADLPKTIEFKILPNPAEHQFSLQGIEEGQGAQLRIYNALGEKMVERDNMRKGEIISVTNWKSGVYWVQVAVDSRVKTLKLIKN